MAVFKTGKDDVNRLRVIQESMDQFTQEVITALPTTTAGNTLEIGAGAGSIARWLAHKDPQGLVEAVDIDVDLLQDDLPANLTVTKADITESDYPAGTFDLVHARFVLSHLPGRDALVEKIAGWIRRGGHLVITEPYQLPPNKSPHKIIQKVFGAYVAFVESRGMSLEWSREVPSLLARTGLESVSHHGRTTFLGGGESDRWAPLLEPVREQLLGQGVTEDELDAFFEALQDPHIMDIPQIIITVTGRKP
ncbi:class I SAM-dependent methyltransferase [Mycobacteroides salmoniphilum]|uniref:Sarcosine/dimethylglycine N-methyltransferase n=1 Tax=Mycobacteroides salmoniphilum TaxID=404941 RepID=A0A4R8SZX3_9MYCO|nr:class I SAM-dependent methyltransferase [Mycobacteroides salmoniphilum]TEA09190.1 Sarcosine/dimethylglycine N-methyltransferase [Mycobacteroides salmoniphilum]